MVSLLLAQVENGPKQPPGRLPGEQISQIVVLCTHNNEQAGGEVKVPFAAFGKWNSHSHKAAKLILNVLNLVMQNYVNMY